MVFNKAFIKLTQGKEIKLNLPDNDISYKIIDEKLIMSDGSKTEDAIFTGEMLLDNRWIIK